MVKYVNAEALEELLASTDKTVFCDFWANWCGPCRMLLPTIEELSSELADKITITKCNVDENPNIAEKFGIMSIPALLIFKNGELVEQRVGGSSKQNLINWINSVIK